MRETLNSIIIMIGFQSIEQDQCYRLLLVEDDNANRQMMHDYLSYCGYEMRSLDSGLNLFQTLTEFHPHLVLLDLKLPDVSGYTLLQQMQEHSMWSQIPVIVVSAFAFRADQLRAINLGARRYFVKPLNLVQLERVIFEELSLPPP